MTSSRLTDLPHLAWSVLLIEAFVACCTANAAPPNVETISPAGGARGSTVKITITENANLWPVQLWSNRPELQFKVLEEKGKAEVTIPADCPPGLAWLRVYNDEGSAVLRPFIIGTLPEVEETEDNNSVEKAQAITGSSVVIHGRHQASEDVDLYALSFKAGQTVVLDLDANRTLRSPSDSVLQLVSPAGFVLAQNDDDQGLDPRIIYTIPADGQYYVRTFAFPASPDSSIRFAGGAKWFYRLTITADRFTDYVLPLSATRGIAGEVTAIGWNFGSEPVKAPFIASDADSLIIAPPGSGNTVTIPVSPLPQLVEQEPNVQVQPQVMPVPGGISGVVSAPDDADFFRFTAKKGQPLVFGVSARSRGSLIDPIVRILNSEGKQLERTDDQGENRDPTLTWNPPADGDYMLTVADLHRQGGPRFYYHVDIAPPQPDFHMTVAANAYVIPIDKPAEVPITIDRRAGFNEEIEIAAENLPEGVTATPAKSAAEGDSAKSVKLVLTGNTKAFSGPLKIVAKSLGNLKLTRTPRYKTEYETEVEHLWLTVIKKP